MPHISNSTNQDFQYMSSLLFSFTDIKTSGAFQFDHIFVLFFLLQISFVHVLWIIIFIAMRS